MQAIMSMVVSIAGFTAPGIISAFILRTPEEVDASPHGREFSPFALFAPLLSLTVLAGHLYVQWIKQPLAAAAAAKPPVAKEPGETSGLLASKENEQAQPRWSREGYRIPSFSAKTAAQRRESQTLMGIPQFSYEDYQECEAHRTRRQSTGSIPIIHAPSHRQMRKSNVL